MDSEAADADFCVNSLSLAPLSGASLSHLSSKTKATGLAPFYSSLEATFKRRNPLLFYHHSLQPQSNL